MNHRLIPMALVASLVALFATWLVFHHREYRVFPSAHPQGLMHFGYTDIADQGTSQVTSSFQDSSRIVMDYKLGAGFAYPYVGMGIVLCTHDSVTHAITKFLNLEGFDSLRIRARSAHSEELRWQIVTNAPSISRPGVPLSNRYLVQNSTLERAWTDHSLWLGSFVIPDWWFQRNNLKPDPEHRHLDQAIQLEIQSSTRLPIGIEDTVEIEEITFVGENHVLGFVLIGIGLFLVAAFGLLNWLERERMRSDRQLQIASRREDLLGQAEKLPLSSHRTDDTKRILDYIGKNYADSELDLEKVCRETGVNRNRLSALLREEVGTTFKGHLTDLRLAEATRALSETDLQVTEIAFKVGFGNVSHFNRVFKEHFEIAPIEFRRKQKKILPKEN